MAVPSQQSDLLGRLQAIEAELGRAGNELRAAEHKAAEAERFKNELTANISHEIRTPLNAILGFSRLLAKEPLTPDQQEKLRYIEGAGNRLLEIVENMLDYSALTAGSVKLRSTVFSPEAAVRGALESIAAAARDKSLDIHFHRNGDVPRFVAGDGTRFRQVIANLLSNAVKFTDVGTISVDIFAETLAPGKVVIRLVVADTGIGIPLDRQRLILEGFAQADGSATRQFGGLGLGLTIARQLVGLMGGNLGFASEAGKGSTFWITVPLAAAKGSTVDRDSRRHASTRRSSANSTRPQGGASHVYRVLVADDDRLCRLLTEAMLKQENCLADLVGNGREAVERFDQCRYDLVLMDWHMPEMDGLSAIRLIRQREAGGSDRVPIVVLTARKDSELCLSAGADDFLAKPFSPDSLIRSIARYLPGLALSSRQSPDWRTTVRSCVPQLRRAVETGDFAELEIRADVLRRHSSKAQSALTDHLMRLQLAARGQSPQRAAMALARLERQLDAVVPGHQVGGETDLGRTNHVAILDR